MACAGLAIFFRPGRGPGSNTRFCLAFLLFLWAGPFFGADFGISNLYCVKDSLTTRSRNTVLRAQLRDFREEEEARVRVFSFRILA
jgi:hypothetical protein